MEFDLGAILIVAIPATITAILAYLQGTKSTRVDAYRAMAERLAVVEERSDKVNTLSSEIAHLNASLTIIKAWVEKAAAWMHEAQGRLSGEESLQLPPLPPPDIFNRRKGDNHEYPTDQQ